MSSVDSTDTRVWWASSAPRRTWNEGAGRRSSETRHMLSDADARYGERRASG
jgi:hypothetical protein